MISCGQLEDHNNVGAFLAPKPKEYRQASWNLPRTGISQPQTMATTPLTLLWKAESPESLS